MATKNIANPPPILGRDAAPHLAQGVFAVESDEITFATATPATLFTVPADTLVLGVICQITEAWDGTGAALDVGVSGTTSRHLATAAITEATLGFYGTALSPYKYTAQTDLIATITPGTSATTGKAKFWLLYRPMSNKQKTL